MTMDYGRGTTNLGGVAIQSAEATAYQLGGIYPTKTSAQRYAMIGITPMIGINDDGTVFTLDDAKAIASYASRKEIRLLSYWALQRDQPGTDVDASSGNQGSEFEYFRAFLRQSPGIAVRSDPNMSPMRMAEAD